MNGLKPEAVDFISLECGTIRSFQLDTVSAEPEGSYVNPTPETIYLLPQHRSKMIIKINSARRNVLAAL